MHNACMNITVRDVPEETRDVLAARAKRSGRSMQEYLRRALIDLATAVDQDELWDRVEERVRREGVSWGTDEILEAIHDGRR